MDYSEINKTVSGKEKWTTTSADAVELISPLQPSDPHFRQPEFTEYLLSPTFSPEEIERYLISDLGERYRNHTESVILTLIYAVIFVSGVIGNVSTCVVIARNSYMHTATNYYLFTLAISDVLTLILGLPPELYTIWEAYPWRFGEPYCLFKTFLTEMTSSASVLTITAFTVERYVAICHPYRAQTMSSLSRAVKIIICIWILACVTSLPYPIHTRTYRYTEIPNTTITIEESLICNIRSEWMPFMRYVFQFSVFILFVIPMALITWLYILIGITLHKSTGLARQASDVSGSPQQCHSRRAVLKMLVAVVVAFFLCWAPFHAQRLMTAFIDDEQWTPTLIEIQSHLFYISGVLYFVSSTVNPILYNLMSKKYRMAFKDTICRCCCCFSQRQLSGRGGMWFFSERSTTYFTMSAHHSVLKQTGRSMAVKFQQPHDNSHKETNMSLLNDTGVRKRDNCDSAVDRGESSGHNVVSVNNNMPSVVHEREEDVTVAIYDDNDDKSYTRVVNCNDTKEGGLELC